MLRKNRFYYTMLLRVASVFLCVACLQILNASPPPFIADRSLGQSLRTDVNVIRDDYGAGRISLARANTRSTAVLRDAYSQRGQWFDRSFPKGVHLDFMRDDIGKITNSLITGNEKNWHGHERELKYINTIEDPDGKFKFLKANHRNRISDGRIVEFDILAEDRRTGAKLAIESKDWKIKSRADLEKAKGQLEKIAKRAREEGVERVAWLNRKGSVSEAFRGELEYFGQKNGVTVYDRVSTGEATVRRGMAQHIDDVMAEESKAIARTSARASARRVVKVIPYVGVAVESGFAIHQTWQWQAGRATTRDFALTSGGAVGGVAGAAGGAWAGAAIGSFFPGPGNIIGAFVGGAVGGVAGHIAGNKTTEYAVDKFYYEKQSDEEKQATIDALIANYSSISGNN